MFAPSNFLNLDQTEHRTLFDNSAQVWDVLKQIGSYLQFRLKPAIYGRIMGRPFISDNVYIGGGTLVENGATIKGPAWIGNNCEIRSGCYIRENVIVGDGVVLGNSCEFKNCIIFNDAEVPHFNYVGDSVLGYQSHLGAGVILSNVRLDHKEISVKSRIRPHSNRTPQIWCDRRRSRRNRLQHGHQPRFFHRPQLSDLSAHSLRRSSTREQYLEIASGSPAHRSPVSDNSRGAASRFGPLRRRIETRRLHRRRLCARIRRCIRTRRPTAKVPQRKKVKSQRGSARNDSFARDSAVPRSFKTA